MRRISWARVAVATVVCLGGTAAPALAGSGDAVEIPLGSCTTAAPDAHGRAQYQQDADGRERLRFDVDDAPELIGHTLDVFVDDELMGSMEVVPDQDEPGQGEGSLRFDTDDGRQPPTTLQGDERVDIREDSASDQPDGERVVSSECDGFDDSGSGSGGGTGTPGGGGGNPATDLVQSLLAALGLGS